MDSRAIINILVSFIIIGVLILLYSVENTLWALYWILFTLYLMVFFSIGLGLHNSLEELLSLTLPIILMSFLITWLIQIFSSKQQLIEEDKMVRRLGLTEKVPNTFYNMYTGVLLLLIVKISLYVGLLRSKLQAKNSDQRGEDRAKLIYLSVYGMTIISFLLLVGMSLVSDYYITDG
jgi:hypothetical protein